MVSGLTFRNSTIKKITLVDFASLLLSERPFQYLLVRECEQYLVRNIINCQVSFQDFDD
jgi:hypothetical protein